MCDEKVAVILAGGQGTRLHPYTLSMPKPLVSVGDYPILEIIIRQLRRDGFTRIILAVNHMASMIQAYFGDGGKLGVSIRYALEEKPLGTMGPLWAMRDLLPDRFLVMNGDVLTDLRFDAFLQAHVRSGRIFTVSAFRRDHRVDYGVLHVDGRGLLNGFEEKPLLHYTVSMGVYALDKRVLSYIPQDTSFGFDHLMHRLLEAGEDVGVSVFDGYWNDIGLPSDYERANEDMTNMKDKFLR